MDCCARALVHLLRVRSLARFTPPTIQPSVWMRGVLRARNLVSFSLASPPLPNPSPIYCALVHLIRVQGYLAHKKHPPP